MGSECTCIVSECMPSSVNVFAGVHLYVSCLVVHDLLLSELQQCQHEEGQNCTYISDSCQMLYLLSTKPVFSTYLWYKITVKCS